MKIVMFVHSLVSDWNHGNAHFLRGVVAELIDRGHDVGVFEPQGGWSRSNLARTHGDAAVTEFTQRFPQLRSTLYDAGSLELHDVLSGADLVIVHEWNEPELVALIGQHRRAPGSKLLFHDTHHRAVTRPESIQQFDLSGYDGVLAFGKVIRDIYIARGWSRRAWTWHEAADTRVFHPIEATTTADLVWIGNWGDGERESELEEYLFTPARALELSGTIHGVRYPPEAVDHIKAAGLRFGGWIPNHRVPQEFARHRLTLHIPRRPYARSLNGVPTIRVFEALACGIPLICAPWDDSERLFRPGRDYLLASSGAEMQQQIKAVLGDARLADRLVRSGLETIRARHTCTHRVDELLSIYEEMS
ncbi:MAG: glycosyltransferase [Nitriliruptorales bacterium]|nr:glycosyltransferase [Nitriliruptorales bacterium]